MEEVFILISLCFPLDSVALEEDSTLTKCVGEFEVRILNLFSMVEFEFFTNFEGAVEFDIPRVVKLCLAFRDLLLHSDCTEDREDVAGARSADGCDIVEGIFDLASGSFWILFLSAELKLWLFRPTKTADGGRKNLRPVVFVFLEISAIP